MFPFSLQHDLFLLNTIDSTQDFPITFSMLFKKKVTLCDRLQSHFSADPASLTVIEQFHPVYNRANLHLAIEELSTHTDSPTELCGFTLSEDYNSVTLSKLSRPETSGHVCQGPVEYVDVQLPNDLRLSCVKRGLYLFRIDGQPLALLITDQEYRREGIVVEVMALEKNVGEGFAHRLSRLVRQSKAFRGQVLSLERDCTGAVTIGFNALPQVSREKIILPEKLLERIERHTISFSEHAERLKAAGRHLKRGILLYGPPGTGKTYSAMYLASRMPGRTVFLMTGAGVGSIETVCGMARILQPATVILEDVDLIGTRRERQAVDANALLFELLNQMDGLADDADILFLLTTNRPDVLEPALASRPGRIDQAIEIPLPDEDCRRRLFSLYSVGLTVDITRSEEFIHRLQGVSAAFIRELLRKAAMFSALDSSEDIIVKDQHVEEALAELLVAGGPLTKTLLGALCSDGVECT
jgi:cell division protease FtsH